MKATFSLIQQFEAQVLHFSPMGMSLIFYLPLPPLGRAKTSLEGRNVHGRPEFTRNKEGVNLP